VLPQTILGHPGVSHRVSEFHQECLVGCLCPTHLPSHRQWLVAKRKATSDPHVLLELYRLTHDEARRLPGSSKGLSSMVRSKVESTFCTADGRVVLANITKPFGLHGI